MPGWGKQETAEYRDCRIRNQRPIRQANGAAGLPEDVVRHTPLPCTTFLKE